MDNGMLRAIIARTGLRSTFDDGDQCLVEFVGDSHVINVRARPGDRWVFLSAFAARIPSSDSGAACARALLELNARLIAVRVIVLGGDLAHVAYDMPTDALRAMPPEQIRANIETVAAVANQVRDEIFRVTSDFERLAALETAYARGGAATAADDDVLF